MNQNISRPGSRFPIQGNCWKAAENCNIPFCGPKGRHQSSGSIPWDLARSAFRNWQSTGVNVVSNGSSIDDALSRIAARGGFGHDFMNTYFGSREWFDKFNERNVPEIPRAGGAQGINTSSS